MKFPAKGLVLASIMWTKSLLHLCISSKCFPSVSAVPPPLPFSHLPAASLWTLSQLHPASQLFNSLVPLGSRRRPTCRASKTSDLESTRLNRSLHIIRPDFLETVTPDISTFLCCWRISGLLWVTVRRELGGFDFPKLFRDYICDTFSSCQTQSSCLVINKSNLLLHNKC